VHSRLVSPTAVVASVVLMSRKAGVSKEMVLDDSNKVASFLGRLGRSLGSNFHADKSLDLLANLVATKRDMFNVTVSPGSDHKTLLLAYYKNQLLNFLFHESVILIAVSTFGS
jgi:glycerol-3-phosphate O-acyltransferase